MKSVLSVLFLFACLSVTSMVARADCFPLVGDEGDTVTICGADDAIYECFVFYECGGVELVGETYVGGGIFNDSEGELWFYEDYDCEADEYFGPNGTYSGTYPFWLEYAYPLFG